MFDAAYTYTVEAWTNDEGSTFAHVNVRWPDGSEEDHRFAAMFDDGPIESASVQASSFLSSLYDVTHYTLEERLGPFGLEWEREQEERRGGW